MLCLGWQVGKIGKKKYVGCIMIIRNVKLYAKCKFKI